MSNIEIFISYAWEKDSNEIAELLYKSLQAKNYSVVLDKKDLGYKGNLIDFERRIGKGNYIITIISDKYLKSEHCMNEMLHIERHENVYCRVFPIILDDARGIYKPKERLRYQTYWKKEIDGFREEIEKHGIDGGLEAPMRDLKRWEQIKLIIGDITNLLAGMNVLTPDMHLNDDFSELIYKLEEQIEKDRALIAKDDQGNLIKSLSAQIRSLQFTTNVFDEFSSADSSYGIFNKIVNQGIEKLKADSAFFHIYSDEDKSLVLVAKSELTIKTEIIQSLFSTDLSSSINKYILNALHNDNNSVLIPKPKKGHLIDDVVQSLLFVPLKIREKIFGVATVLSFKEDKIFNESDENALKFITERAASAIENIALYENVYDNLFSMLNILVKVIEAKDLDTKKHSERVAIYAHMIAEKLECTEEELDIISFAGKLHDIGKIGISDEILLKPGKLTEDEYEKIKEHTIIGAEIVGTLGLWDREMEIIRHHHERYDGKGYPDGLIRKEIPFLARIVFVAECFDAMTSNTVYRKKIEKKNAIDWIKNHSGSCFDPKVVDAFLDIENEIMKVTD